MQYQLGRHEKTKQSQKRRENSQTPGYQLKPQVCVCADLDLGRDVGLAVLAGRFLLPLGDPEGAVLPFFELIKISTFSPSVEMTNLGDWMTLELPAAARVELGLHRRRCVFLR